MGLAGFFMSFWTPHIVGVGLALDEETQGHLLVAAKLEALMQLLCDSFDLVFLCIYRPTLHRQDLA